MELMSTSQFIDCVDEGEGLALLKFSGHDALRYLNGQVTQDVRQVGGLVGLPACVTDAKGHLQFRVWLYALDSGCYWVAGPSDAAEALEQRLTRYLIADDVEVEDLTGRYRLLHLLGETAPVPEGVVVRRVNRYGQPGVDWWIPSAQACQLPAELHVMSADAVEDLRIRRGIPAWGKELVPGMLPPEAGLEVTDISYQKGCYIGQEVISRIKSAGKLNRRLVQATSAMGDSPDWRDAQGEIVDEITSIAPSVVEGLRYALGYQKRRRIPSQSAGLA